MILYSLSQLAQPVFKFPAVFCRIADISPESPWRFEILTICLRFVRPILWNGERLWPRWKDIEARRDRRRINLTLDIQVPNYCIFYPLWIVDIFWKIVLWSTKKRAFPLNWPCLVHIWCCTRYLITQYRYYHHVHILQESFKSSQILLSIDYHLLLNDSWTILSTRFNMVAWATINSKKIIIHFVYTNSKSNRPYLTTADSALQ